MPIGPRSNRQAIASSFSARVALGLLPLPSRLQHGNLLQDLAELPLAPRLFLLAISPAICEELFFRGALLSGLRRDLRVVPCLAWQALLFGAAHGSIYRFVPTALLGMVLTSIVLRSRSLLPAILLHAAYNTVLLWEVDSPWLVWLAAPGLIALGLPAAGEAARPPARFAVPGDGTASKP